MSDIIQQRLAGYSLDSIDDEQCALKEILQEIILYSLAKKDFFQIAAFQGGTALRLLYNLPRFSEDLDFVLKKPEPSFSWEYYKSAIEHGCELLGVKPEIIDKSKLDNTVKKMFLKDNSIGKMINLHFHHHARQKLRIKLEIDTNPPEGAAFEQHYLEFPVEFPIIAENLPSLFAGKCHTLLARSYIKGRDWYDFCWYVQRKIVPNFALLTSALHQQGPWATQNIAVTAEWLINALEEKIKTIDWEKTRDDVLPFLSPPESDNIQLWSQEFFLYKCKKFRLYLGNTLEPNNS